MKNNCTTCLYVIVKLTCVDTTDIKGRFQKQYHFHPVMGLKLGGIQVSMIKIHIICQVHNKHLWKPHDTRRLWTHFVCVSMYFVCVCSGWKPEYPQFEPHCWGSHGTRQHMRSGISVVYLWLISESKKVYLFINFRALPLQQIVSNFTRSLEVRKIKSRALMFLRI